MTDLALFNGSIVRYDGAPHRVVGRSADGTYDLAPVTAGVVTWSNRSAHTVARFALDHDNAQAEPPAGVVRHYHAIEIGADRAWDVPEAEIEALHAHDTVAYAEATHGGATVAGGAVDQAHFGEGIGIARA